MVVVWLAWVSVLMGADAGAIYRDAQKAEKAGQMAKAYLLYSQAAALEPMNVTYWIRSQAVRTRALLETNSTPRFDADAQHARQSGRFLHRHWTPSRQRTWLTPASRSLRAS